MLSENNLSLAKQVLNLFSVTMNFKPIQGLQWFHAPQTKQTQIYHIRQQLPLAYNGRKQKICFAIAVSAAYTNECCYHLVITLFAPS